MKMRTCRLMSGKMFNIFEVRNMKTSFNQPGFQAYIGSSTSRPKWVSVFFTKGGKPYVWFEGSKLYLDDFVSAA